MQSHGCLLGSPGWFDPTSRVLAFTLGGVGGDPDLQVIVKMDDQEVIAPGSAAVSPQ